MIRHRVDICDRTVVHRQTGVSGDQVEQIVIPRRLIDVLCQTKCIEYDAQVWVDDRGRTARTVKVAAQHYTVSVGDDSRQQVRQLGVKRAGRRLWWSVDIHKFCVLKATTENKTTSLTTHFKNVSFSSKADTLSI